MFRVAVIGDADVGKTSFIKWYVQSQSQMESEPTPENGTYKTTISMGFGAPLEIEISDIDIIGRMSAAEYIERNDAFLVMYSVDQPKSLTKAEEILRDINDIKGNASKTILVGNKADIPKRAVIYDEGRQIAEIYRAMYMETCIKGGVNISQAFSGLAYLLTKEEEVEEDHDFLDIAVRIISSIIRIHFCRL